MIAAAELIKEAEASGALVTIEGGQLKLIPGKLLPASLLDKMRPAKSEILELVKRDQDAREVGFLPLRIGEVYERQFADNSHVFIIRNDSGKWDAWRESWSRKENQGQSKAAKSASHKNIESDCTTFDYALLKAKQYLQYLSKSKGV